MNERATPWRAPSLVPLSDEELMRLLKSAREDALAEIRRRICERETARGRES